MKRVRILTSLATVLAAGAAIGLAPHAAVAQTQSNDVDRMIVTATPLHRDSTELAIPITVLNRAEILRKGAGSLGSLLADQPGIAESSFAAGASRPIIRGLDNFRVRIQENGIGAHDVSALSEDHGVPLDPLSAERIEVVRGPATLRYGSESIGGVVNVLNNRIPETLPDRLLTGEVFGSLSSVDDGLEGAALVDGKLGSVGWHVDAFRRDAEDYRIPGTPDKQSRTSMDATGVAGGASLVHDRGFAGLSAAYFTSDYAIPAAEEALAIDLEQLKLAFKSEFRELGSIVDRIRLNVGFADYTHDEVAVEEGLIGSTFDNEEWEGRLEALHAPIGAFEGAVGVQVRHRELSGSGEAGELIAPAETRAIAGFIFEEVKLSDRLTFQVGGRVEHVKVEGIGFDPLPPDGMEFAATRDFTPLSASASFLLDVGWDVSLGITGQAVQRAPDALELFSKGPHEATETFEIGDADLGKETAFSGELTLKREEGPFTFEVAAFYTSYRDFIFKAFTGVECGEDFDTCGVEDDLRQIAYSQDDATFHGVEISARWQAAEVWRGHVGVDGRFDFVRGELDASGNVPRIPPQRYGLGVFYEDDQLFARVAVRRVGKQDRLAAFETGTKGYTHLDAQVGLRLPWLDDDRDVVVSLTGTNLLDEESRNHVSFKKEDVLLPGRNIRLALNVGF